MPFRPERFAEGGNIVDEIKDRDQDSCLANQSQNYQNGRKSNLNTICFPHMFPLPLLYRSCHDHPHSGGLEESP